jgi:GNAT superfamily N-acetyltransferase
MISTWINTENAKFFLGGIPKQALREADFLLGAIDDVDGDLAVGALSAKEEGHTIRILSLFVQREKRRLGAGRAMITELLSYAAGQGYDAVTVSIAQLGEEETTDGFFEALKFLKASGGRADILELPIRENAGAFAGNEESADSLKTLRALSGRELDQLRNAAKEAGSFVSEWDNYDRGVSVGIVEDRKVRTFLLAAEYTGYFQGWLILSEGSTPHEVEKVLAAVMRKLSESAPVSSLVLHTEKKEVRFMVEAVCAGKTVKHHREQTWYFAL